MAYYLWQHCDASDAGSGREPDTYMSSTTLNKISQHIRCLETVQVNKISIYTDSFVGGNMTIKISTDSANNGYGTILGTSDVVDSNFDGHGSDGVARWVDFVFSTPVTVSSDFWFSPTNVTSFCRWYTYFNPGDIYMTGANPSYDVDNQGLNQPTVTGYIEDLGFRMYTVNPAIDIINEDFEGFGLPGKFYDAKANWDWPWLINENLEQLGTPTDWGGYQVNWDYTTAPAPLTGKQSALFNVAYAYYQLTTTPGELFAKISILLDVIPTANYITLIALSDPTQSYTVCYVGVQITTGCLIVADHHGNQVLTTNGLAANTAYDLYFHYKKGTGANAIVEAEFVPMGSSRTGTGNAHAAMTNSPETDNVFQFTIGNYPDTNNLIMDNIQVSDIDMFAGGSSLALAGTQSCRSYIDAVRNHYTLANYPANVDYPEVWTKMRVKIIAPSSNDYLAGFADHTQKDFGGSIGSITFNDTLGVTVDFGTWLPFTFGTAYYLWIHAQKNVVFEIWWGTTDDRAAAALAGNHLSTTGGNFYFGFMNMTAYGIPGDLLFDNLQIATTDMFAVGGGGGPPASSTGGNFFNFFG